MVVFLAPVAATAGGDVFGQAGVVNLSDGGGTHALAGGGASYAVGDNVAVFGEVDYVPLGDFGFSTEEIGLSTHLLLVGGGARFYIPIGSSTARLYVPAAGGLLRLSVDADVSDISVSVSMNGGYVGGGFGVEIGQKLGVRPEFRYNRYQISGAGTNVYSGAVSVFYRFGGN